MPVRVILSGKVLAESDATIVVENNHYFPPDSVNKSLLNDKSETTSVCPWKGTAKYYNAKFEEGDKKVEVEDVAWYYPEPKEKANHIKDYVAFYKNKVTIEVNK